MSGKFTGKYKNLNPKLLKEVERVLDSIGVDKLEITSGFRTNEDITRILREENILNRSFDLRDWTKKSKPVVKDASNIKPLSDFKEYPEAFSILSDAVLRLGKYSNKVDGKKTKGAGIAQAYKEIDALSIPSNTKKKMKDSLAAVRQNFGGYDSSHMEGIKLDTSLNAFRRVIGNEEEALSKFRQFKEAVERNPNLQLNDEESNNNVADIALVKNPKPYKDYGEQFGPSDEEIKEPSLVKRLKKETNIEEPEEKEYGGDFSKAFEKAIKDKGEGEIFNYRDPKNGKLRKVLLKRAEPNVEEVEPESTKFEDMLAEYKSLKTPIESGQSLEGDVPTQEEMNYIPEEEMEQETMSDIDPREMELQRLIKKGEELKQRDIFKDGGRKYQAGGGDFKSTIAPYAAAPIEKPIEEPTSEIRKRSVSPEGMIQGEDVANKEYEAAEIVPSEKPVMEFPEAPKEEAKPMTMQDLESEYKKLMEASSSERKTAQWATAATQIAATLDKYSARPMGIQPINFQANDNSTQIKELLQLGRMKGLGVNNQMTPYQRESLNLRKKELESSNKKKSAEPSFEEKETTKANVKEKVKLRSEQRAIRRDAEKVLGPLDVQLKNAEEALKLLENIKEEGAYGLGVTDTGPLDQFIVPYSEKGRALEKRLNNISLKAMTSMFKGMAKAIDSDSERRFFEKTQPNLGDFSSTNAEQIRELINNMKSLKKKTQETIKKYDSKGNELERTPMVPPHGEETEQNGKKYKWNAVKEKYQLKG